MKNLILLLISFLCYSGSQAQVLDTLINTNGFKMHFNIIKGKGTPIIFESGNGDDASVWKEILQSIHKSTGATLITYDRAGLGSSEIDTLKINFKSEVESLKKGLEKLGYNKNYFLVAHSFGGIYASEFTNISKGKVRGVVFIDVATPCELNIQVSNRVKNAISDENWKLLKQYKIGLYYVLQNLPEIAKYMENRYISNAIPMTLIVADKYVPTEEIGETQQDMINWQKCLKKLGTLPNHKYVTTKDTDHKVWEKDPKTVINEIVKLYEQTKFKVYK